MNTRQKIATGFFLAGLAIASTYAFAADAASSYTPTQLQALSKAASAQFGIPPVILDEVLADVGVDAADPKGSLFDIARHLVRYFDQEGAWWRAASRVSADFSPFLEPLDPNPLAALAAFESGGRK